MIPPPDPLQDSRFAALRARLEALAAPEPSADFTDRVMARVRAASTSRWSCSSVALRTAAALVVLLSLYVLHTARQRQVASLPPSPVEILMASQRGDGGWSADAAQMRPRYDTGVTALAVLALIQSDPHPLDEGPREAAIRAGLHHLLRQQTPDGRLAADFSGGAFTHYLATKAMESGAALPGADPAWHAAAHRAKPHLPSATQMATLNHHLANPAVFPARWAEAGGAATHTALHLLQR
ncbi:MAG: hypothetical protein PHO14_02315 [Kiritimatiellae bacterium]|jgi:hypothetical protein|nr:hypothetical protein [Kiritimatiellia bacterium]MDD4341050.1 hypothetical protein [Kiritimatiellia bacterium]MDY0149756.1 hypothetical protein [Kiritimatiellia bacterium]